MTRRAASPHKEPRAVHRDGRLVSMTIRELNLGECRCCTTGHRLTKVYADCPEHGQVPRLTGEQWTRLNAIDEETPEKAWERLLEIHRGVRVWKSTDVIPVQVTGIGRRWTAAIELEWRPRSFAEQITTLVFPTRTGGYYRFDDLPVSGPQPSDLAG